MSIMIKGKKMPKVPGVYSLDLYVEEICQIQNLDGGTFEAIEIPPHGDLIDRDELLSQYGGPIWTAKTDYAEGLRDVVADIKCAAAIIGAEPCNDLAKPNNTIFAVQNADEDEWLFAAKPIDYMHTPSVEEIIKGDGE